MAMFRVCASVHVAILTLVLANPASADETRINALRQRIDELDAKIKQVVRDIAVTTDKAAILELNRQMKQYETQKSTALFDLYKARELEEKRKKLISEVGSYEQSLKMYNTDFSRHKDDIESHNRDAQNQRQAVAHYNSLPSAQKIQAEYARLNRWHDLVDTRASVLEAKSARLRTRGSELNNWRSRLLAELKALQ